MTKEQIEQYESLNKIFQEDCERIAKVLSDYDVFTKRWETSDITYAQNFSICGVDVDWNGDEYWNYGGHEYHSGSFPVSYLSMTENELRAAAEKENNAYLDELRKRKEKRQKAQDAADYEQYKRLKEKFGD